MDNENVEMQAPQGTIYRQVTVLVNDVSDTTLNINTFGVTFGLWDPAHMPTNGQQIGPGDNPSFVNYTDKPYTAVSGYITLSPTSGGLITLGWDWKYGSPFQNTSSTQNTTLGVKSTVVGQTGTTVTVQYQISNQSA